MVLAGTCAHALETEPIHNAVRASRDPCNAAKAKREGWSAWGESIAGWETPLSLGCQLSYNPPKRVSRSGAATSAASWVTSRAGCHGSRTSPNTSTRMRSRKATSSLEKGSSSSRRLGACHQRARQGHPRSLAARQACRVERVQAPAFPHPAAPAAPLDSRACVGLRARRRAGSLARSCGRKANHPETGCPHARLHRQVCQSAAHANASCHSTDMPGSRVPHTAASTLLLPQPLGPMSVWMVPEAISTCRSRISTPAGLDESSDVNLQAHGAMRMVPSASTATVESPTATRPRSHPPVHRPSLHR